MTMNTRLSPDATHIAASDGLTYPTSVSVRLLSPSSAVPLLPLPASSATGTKASTNAFRSIANCCETRRCTRNAKIANVPVESGGKRCQDWEVCVATSRQRERKRRAPMMTAVMKQTVTISAVPKRRTRSARGKYGASLSPSGMKPAPT